MPRQSGEQHDVLGPIVFEKGMSGAPLHELPPQVPENVWNLDYDHASRPVPRHGSVFQARIGTGPVVGMHEHTFESGALRPRQAAIVQEAFPEVYSLVNPDPHMVNGEPQPGEPDSAHDIGFCPDWRQHGRVILPIPGRLSDRFHMVSFLNRLYIAGSTLDHRIRVYDYDQQLFWPIDDIRGRSVAAVGNRLFVAGDPNRPNIVFPSNPDEPEEFQEQLGIQIGTRNDEILTMLDHEGLVVIFTNRSAHWLLAGAVELGDLETEPISRKHGLVGPLAASVAADGWVYWISPSEGPLRWRRGSGAPDRSFLGDFQQIWKVVLKGRNKGAVVFDDVSAGAVRFLISTGDCPEPNYMLSYFYRGGEGWTHGASTTKTSTAAKIRDFADTLDTKLGQDWYTAAISTEDPLLGGHRPFTGDDQGHIWAWSRGVYDRVRGYSHAPGPFRCFFRPGPFQIGPMGHRGMIHRAMLNLLAGYNWSFRLDSELDFADDWENVQHAQHVTPGGMADQLILNDSVNGRPLNRYHHPTHYRVPFWSRGLARVVRADLSFDPLYPVVPLSIELERSMAAEGRKQNHTPPKPFGRTADWCEEPDEPCPPIDVSEIEFPELA